MSQKPSTACSTTITLNERTIMAGETRIKHPLISKPTLFSTIIPAGVTEAQLQAACHTSVEAPSVNFRRLTTPSGEKTFLRFDFSSVQAGEFMTLVYLIKYLRLLQAKLLPVVLSFYIASISHHTFDSSWRTFSLLV